MEYKDLAVKAYAIMHSGFFQTLVASRESAEKYAQQKFPGSPEVEIIRMTARPTEL